MFFIGLIPIGHSCLLNNYLGICPYNRMIKLDDGEIISYCIFMEIEILKYNKMCNIKLFNEGV